MGILPYKVLCNAALFVFHISLLKVALSKVLDPDIEMKGKSGAGDLKPIWQGHSKSQTEGSSAPINCFLVTIKIL